MCRTSATQQLSTCRKWYVQHSKHSMIILVTQPIRLAHTRGHVAGTCRGDFVPATNPIVWTLDFHEKSCCGDEILSPRHVPWIQISLNLRGHVAATKQRYTPVKRKVASCELFMRHVPATLRKINQSENEITTCPCDKTLRVNTSRNLSPQHAPSCEQRMKFFPATCPCNMSPRVSRPISITPVLSFARKASEKILPVKTIIAYSRPTKLTNWQCRVGLVGKWPLKWPRGTGSVTFRWQIIGGAFPLLKGGDFRHKRSSTIGLLRRGSRLPSD